MTTDRAHPNTKAHWRRRALRAEAELAGIRQIRQAEAAVEIQRVRENAADLATALKEVP